MAVQLGESGGLLPNMPYIAIPYNIFESRIQLFVKFIPSGDLMSNMGKLTEILVIRIPAGSQKP